MAEEEQKLHCCYIDQSTDKPCKKPAEYEIWDDTREYTHSCEEHVGPLLSNADLFRIYRV